MDLWILKKRYKQFGGLRLVWAYMIMGVVPVIIREFCQCVFKGLSFKAIYPHIGNKINTELINRFLHDVDTTTCCSYYSNTPRVIWWSWLQGEENAPDIVRACLNSLRRNITDREICIIDAENWTKYVTMPDYIIKKWEKGYIPQALFADLLRLELLIRYGGTWIDSTVLCTVDQSDESRNLRKKMSEYLNADLFFFQYTRPKDAPFGGCSNWFISANAGDKMLTAIRDSIYAYWQEYDCVVQYYIFHLFLAELVRRHPELIAKMPYGYSGHSLVLMNGWNQSSDENRWQDIVNHVVFHKLSFRIDDATLNDKGNFYHAIIDKYSI